MPSIITVLAVKDIEKAKAFYMYLFGFKIKYNFGINICFEENLSLQQDFARIMQVPKETMRKKENNFELSLEISKFDEFIQKLKNDFSVEFLHDIFEHNWGQRVIRFYDLDFHLIEVGESMVSVAKRYLAQGFSVEETSKKTQYPIDFIENCLE